MSSQNLTLFDIDDPARPNDARTPEQRRRGRTSPQRVHLADPARQADGVEPQPSSLEIRQVCDGPLPPTLDVVTAGTILGVGRTVAYRLVRQGKWPTHVVRIGRKIVIPTLPLLEFVGIKASDVPEILALSTSSHFGLGPLVVEAASSTHPAIER